MPLAAARHVRVSTRNKRKISRSGAEPRVPGRAQRAPWGASVASSFCYQPPGAAALHHGLHLLPLRLQELHLCLHLDVSCYTQCGGIQLSAGLVKAEDAEFVFINGLKNGF